MLTVDTRVPSWSGNVRTPSSPWAVFAPPITFPLSASLFCLSCRYFMGRHPYYRVVNMRIILDRGLGWGNNSTGQVRGVWKFGEGG